MFTDYLDILKFIKAHIPVPVDAHSSEATMTVINNLYKSRCPDYWHMPDYAISELNGFEYNSIMDAYKTSASGIFGAMSVIVQNDLVKHSQLHTNPADPILIAETIDRLRYKKVVTNLLQGHLPGVPNKDVQFAIYDRQVYTYLIKTLHDLIQ